jgi:hypothetical protein
MTGTLVRGRLVGKPVNVVNGPGSITVVLGSPVWPVLRLNPHVLRKLLGSLSGSLPERLKVVLGCHVIRIAVMFIKFKVN